MLKVARLTGVYLHVRKANRWKCPFSGCPGDFHEYKEVVTHIEDTHDEDQRKLFSQLGSFWAPLVDHFHRRGVWPTVFEMLTGDIGGSKVVVEPQDQEDSDEIWKASTFQIGPSQLKGLRLLPDSPLEGIIRRLQLTVSDITSTETSEAETAELRKYMRQTLSRREQSILDPSEQLEQGPDPEVIGEQDEDTEQESEQERHLGMTWSEDQRTVGPIKECMEALVQVLQLENVQGVQTGLE
jgi:hypothetical protein